MKIITLAVATLLSASALVGCAVDAAPEDDPAQADTSAEVNVVTNKFNHVIGTLHRCIVRKP